MQFRMLCKSSTACKALCRVVTSQFVVGGFEMGVSRDASHNPKGVDCASLIPRHRRSRAAPTTSDTHTTEIISEEHVVK